MENENRGTFRFFIKIFRGWKRFQNSFASALDVDLERKVEIYTSLSQSATLKDLVYWLQILFSAGIATLGLVLNSSAVIIGAMLISPLMAPILSAGLAFATGDITLGVRALVNLFLSTLLGIAFAVILVALLPFKSQTAEIIARTSPNTLDLVIALFSGAIGSIATCREVKGVVTSIPGVAIAVALMPPLCVVGYGIGVAVSLDFSVGWEIASGGGLLYLTNLVAITFTAMLVFVMLRLSTPKVRDAVRAWRDKDVESQWWLTQINKIPMLEKAREVRSFSLRLLMVLVPLLIIFFPLSESFSKLRTEITQKQSENRVNKVAREIWDNKYTVDTEGNIRSYLDELKVNSEDGKTSIFMRVFDNVPYTNPEKAEYVKLLANRLGVDSKTISLQILEIPTSARERINPVMEATPTPVTIAQRQAGYLQEINNGLKNFKLPSPATLVDYSIITKQNGASYLQIFYLSERDIEIDGENTLKDVVRNQIKLPNLGLVLMRIASNQKTIRFKKNGTEFIEESTKTLEELADELREHPNLRARIMLKPGELKAKREKILREFFVEKNSVPEGRLIFGEAEEEDSAETVQLFVGK